MQTAPHLRLQVEDMLKRSFAEFHAQRAAPDALEALQKGRARLDELRGHPWPASLLGTRREEVARYHALSQRIEALTVELQVRCSCCGPSSALIPHLDCETRRALPIAAH